MKLSRRSIIKAGIGFSASFFARPVDVFAQAQPLLQKKIPSSGESIPIIGIGTARRYEEVKSDAEKVPLRETIRQFQALGGKVIDSSPSYGTAEAVVGELVDGLKIRDSCFSPPRSACATWAGKKASSKSRSRSRNTGPTRST